MADNMPQRSKPLRTHSVWSRRGRIFWISGGNPPARVDRPEPGDHLDELALAVPLHARDPEHGAAFLARHQDKLMYGSDCSDASAVAAQCSGLRQLEQIRRLAPNKVAERKILHGNAKRLFRL